MVNELEKSKENKDGGIFSAAQSVLDDEQQTKDIVSAAMKDATDVAQSLIQSQSFDKFTV